MSRRASRLLQRLIKSSSPDKPNGTKMALARGSAIVLELFIAREAEQRESVRRCSVSERRHIWHQRYLKFCFSRWRFGSEFGREHLQKKKKKRKKSNSKPCKLRINLRDSAGIQGEIWENVNEQQLHKGQRNQSLFLPTHLFFEWCYYQKALWKKYD